MHPLVAAPPRPPRAGRAAEPSARDRGCGDGGLLVHSHDGVDRPSAPQARRRARAVVGIPEVEGHKPGRIQTLERARLLRRDRQSTPSRPAPRRKVGRTVGRGRKEQKDARHGSIVPHGRGGDSISAMKKRAKARKKTAPKKKTSHKAPRRKTDHAPLEGGLNPRRASRLQLVEVPVELAQGPAVHLLPSDGLAHAARARPCPRAPSSAP